MKTALLYGIAMFLTISAFGQNEPATANSSPRTRQSFNAVNQTSSTASPANQPIGSADQLAAQLRNLRAAIEQSLPALSSFSQTYSNSAGAGQQSAGGALSGLLSGVLKKNTNSNNTATTSGQSSLSASNLVATLRSLVKTNNSGSAASTTTEAATIKDLNELQTHLEASLQVLQRLNVESATTTSGQSIKYLTPTGR